MSDAFYDTVLFDNIKRVAITPSEVSKYSLCENDILVARRSLNFEGAAKPCRVPKIDRPLIFESSLIRITPDRAQLHPLFLFFYLSEPRVRKQFLLKHITQSTISGINQSNLNRVEIVLPPIKVQEKFVAIYEKCDLLRRSLNVSFGDLDLLLKSLSNSLFKCHPINASSNAAKVSTEEENALQL